jgi:hypothetical protein
VTLYFLVGEILERFAPAVARAEIIRTTPDQDAVLDAIEELRRRQAARALRAAIP